VGAVGKPAFGLFDIFTVGVLQRRAFFECRDRGPERRVVPDSVVIAIDVIERFARAFIALARRSMPRFLDLYLHPQLPNLVSHLDFVLI